MALGFFMGLKNGIGRFMDPDGNVVKIPGNKVPKNLKPGMDFDYRAPKTKRPDPNLEREPFNPADKKKFKLEQEPHKPGGKGEMELMNIRIAEPVSAKTSKATNSPRDRQQFVMKRLIAKGWTAPQAAGIVGRFTVESFPDLRTNAVGDKEIPGASHGIGQWNRERKAAMLAYTTGKIPPGKYSNHPLVVAAHKASPGPGDRNDLGRQVDFFDWEIKNDPGERIAYMAIKRAKTAADAGTGMMHYERPRGYTTRNPSGGMHHRETVKRSENIMAQYDPNYTPKVAMAGHEKDVDAAKMIADVETGDALAMEAIQPLIEEDPTLAELFGLENDDGTSEEDEEDTFGSAVSTASEEIPAGEGADTSDNWAFLQAMMQQGQQASQGGAFPSFKDLFGEPG